MAQNTQYMPLYSVHSVNMQNAANSIKKMKSELIKATNTIKYYQTKVNLLEQENAKLKNNIHTFTPVHTISNIAKLSKASNNVRSIKHPKSFSNLATHLALEKCQLIHDILTDDEEDE